MHHQSILYWYITLLYTALSHLSFYLFCATFSTLWRHKRSDYSLDIYALAISHVTEMFGSTVSALLIIKHLGTVQIDTEWCYHHCSVIKLWHTAHWENAKCTFNQILFTKLHWRFGGVFYAVQWITTSLRVTAKSWTTTTSFWLQTTLMNCSGHQRHNSASALLQLTVIYSASLVISIRVFIIH